MSDQLKNLKGVSFGLANVLVGTRLEVDNDIERIGTSFSFSADEMLAKISETLSSVHTHAYYVSLSDLVGRDMKLAEALLEMFEDRVFNRYSLDTSLFRRWEHLCRAVGKDPRAMWVGYLDVSYESAEKLFANAFGNPFVQDEKKEVSK